MRIQHSIWTTTNTRFRKSPIQESKKKSEKKKVDAITTDFVEKYNWGLGTNNVREFTLSEG